MRYEFDKKRTAKQCPCGKDNKDGKFGNFQGFVEYGHCFSCGKWFYPPKDGKIDYISLNYKWLEQVTQSNLIKWLILLFGENEVLEACRKYRIGYVDGYTVFYLSDREGVVRSGKMIKYKNESRDKDTKPNYVHRYLNIQNFEYKTTYFGSHLPMTGSNTYVCESEKSALIAHLYTGARWIATGGKTNINHLDNFQNVIMYPDNEPDAIELWGSKGYVDASWVELLKTKPAGYDVGDYYMFEQIDKIEREGKNAVIMYNNLFCF